MTSRLYSDRGLAGGGITAFASRASGTGSSSCFISINGLYVAIPASEITLSGSEAKSMPAQELVVPYREGGMPPEVLNPPEGMVIKLMAPPAE
jgi:hypothetical protein